MEQLKKCELAEVNAGIYALPAEKCPFDATCPNKYPGCYQPSAQFMAACCVAVNL